VLTLEQAQTDADFGAYVSKSVPPRFSFVSSLKSTGQVENSLSVLWKETTGSSDGSINWRIFNSATDEQNRIVSVNEREKYDMAYYSSPWDESVPDELLGCFENPVFLSEELTLDMLQARTYHADNGHDGASGLRMDFSVLYGDVVVLVSTKGATPEQVFEMLTGLAEPQAAYKGAVNTDNWASTDD